MTSDPEYDEPWQSVSGYVPFIFAEARLQVIRRAMPAIAATTAKILEDVQADAQEQLALIRTDDEASVYINEAEEYFTDQISWTSDELPRLFFGQLVVYLLSLLESTLFGCLESASAVLGLPLPRRIGNPKLEKSIEALGNNYGVQVEWSTETWSALRSWREIRNAVVHDIELQVDTEGESRREILLSVSSVERLLDLVELAINGVDQAMDSLERA